MREQLGMMTIELNMLKQGPTETSVKLGLTEFAAEHTWPEAGPLGMKLAMRPRDRKEKSGLRVDSVTREDIPQALVGLKLAEVNGESVMECTYDEALATVKGATRPLTIKFVKV